jgi:capsid protein
MKFNPIKAARVFFGYDATETKGRRNSAPVSSKSEDRELDASNRKILNSNAADQHRNNAVLRWMINKDLDFKTKFSIQVRTDNPELNQTIEDLIIWWSRPGNCDIAGRHSFQELIRITERLALITGDAGLLKLRSGQLQGIEGTRVRDAVGEGAPDLTGKNVTQGVIHNTAGRAISYIINKRTKSGFQFERIVKSRDLEWRGFYDRFDQIRGISPLACALNTIRDLYESFEYSLIKAKMHAVFGVAIMSEGAGDDGFRQDAINDKDTDGDEDIDTDDSPRYEFKLRPAMKLELLPGDKIETIESKTPSGEFQDYSVLMIQIALLSLDIPLTFFDSRKSSFVASRSDYALYMESVERKRQATHEVIRNILFWKLGQWTRTTGTDGAPLLALPEGMTIRDIKLEVIPTGMPWIDPVKEVTAGAKEIAIGVQSRQRYCRARGRDFWTIKNELAEEEKALVAAGVTVEVATPGATTTRDEEGANNPANTDDDTDAPAETDDNNEGSGNE